MEAVSQAGGAAAAAAAANSSSDFVRKLYKMLEDPSYDQVVRWGNDGGSFVVLENEKFTKSILPKHFKHSNFASFVRQLNKYDFHKVRHNNEENGQSPYGPGAWEFKHPEFKMNSKDSLDNIRRKAPAPRKPTAAGEEMIPTQQMDLVNTQMLAMQQQLQQLSDRYNELSMHHSVLLNEMIGVQKSVVNHEHVMQNVMSYLHSAESFIRGQRRNSRVNGPFGGIPDEGPRSGTVDSTNQQISPIDDTPPSPLQNAEKLLNESDSMMSHRNLDSINDLYNKMNHVSTPPPEAAPSRSGTSQSMHGQSHGLPTPVGSGASMGYARLSGEPQEVVYPAGQTNGIDPMFSEHINNIPYPMPATGELEPSDPRKQFSEGRKKSTTIDPGWVRPPQILLVEDDPTCRRIGSKFLYSFKCAIDIAFDGLEAVNKMNAGSKYDLVLMDIIMPNLDGVSACHLIRQFDSTPIIAMTSNIRSDDITMYFAHGMNDVLPKPFTKEGLLNMLEKHLGHLKQQKGIDTMQPQHLAPNSARQSLKDESSPAKSPMTSTWQSPNQLPGVSPTQHTLNDEYMNSLRGSAGYGMDSGVRHDSLAYQSPGGSMSAPRSAGHRRQLSDMASAEDLTSEAKRQRVYAPPLAVPPMGGGMQRGRPGG